MTTYVAFLRAIYHMKMERLIEPFEAMEFDNVDTFLASGNVIFDTASEETSVLERDIEDRLADALEKETPTFVRSADNLVTIAEARPFGGEGDEEGNNLYIAFLKETPTKDAIERLQTKRSDVDEFHIEDRVVYWLCRTKQSKSSVSGVVLEKTLGQKATVRNIRTVWRIVEKYL